MFFLGVQDTTKLEPRFRVGLLPAIGAGVTLVASIFLFLYAHRLRDSFRPSFATYALFIVSASIIIYQTGGTSSPYLSLWIILGFMSPVFAAYGWVMSLVIIGVTTGFMFMSDGISANDMAVIFISGIMPVVAGLIAWGEMLGHVGPTQSRNTQALASELSEVAQKSEIIINAIGDGVMALDSQGTIELINPAAQEILGWGKQDALALNYKSILKLTDANKHEIETPQDPVQQVLNTNQTTRENKLLALTQSGKYINLSIVVSPIGEAGSGAIIVFRDTTKEMAEGREQAEFISTASHEMRTPVASIEGFLGLALNPATAQIDERAKTYLNKAHEAAQHLGRLFQDLLDVTKSDDGRMTNNPRVVDMTTLTESIVQGLLQKADGKNIRLIFKPNDNAGLKKIMPVLYVNQDNDHIREILDNLIENAIKYTREGSVTVDVRGTDEKVIVSIADTGLGIPPEDLPHLFQKFYRINNADRQDIGGTGLGLYLARRLAEAMQGRLWVDSVFKQGSTFYLELPRVNSTEAQALIEQQKNQLPAPVQTQTQTQTQPQPETYIKADIQYIETPAPFTPQQPEPTAETQPAQTQPAPVPQPPQSPQVQPVPQPAVQPATTVPRGESLTREQIMARARQLEELARQQREQRQQMGGVPPRQ